MFTVISNNYIAPEEVQEYKRFISESTPTSINTIILKSILINGHREQLTNHVIKFAPIPKLQNKTLQINGTFYRYLPTHTASYYDSSTGLLLKENLSNTYIRASKGEVTIGDYSSLIPTPIHKLLKDLQIDIEPLTENAIELVLIQAKT